MNLQNSNQPGSHWIALKRVNNTIFVFDSFGIGYLHRFGANPAFAGCAQILVIYTTHYVRKCCE